MVDVTLFPGWTPLIYATSNGHLPVVKHLLEHKASIEAKNNNGMFLSSATAVLSGPTLDQDPTAVVTLHH